MSVDWPNRPKADRASDYMEQEDILLDPPGRRQYRLPLNVLRRRPTQLVEMVQHVPGSKSAALPGLGDPRLQFTTKG